MIGQYKLLTLVQNITDYVNIYCANFFHIEERRPYLGPSIIIIKVRTEDKQTEELVNIIFDNIDNNRIEELQLDTSYKVNLLSTNKRRSFELYLNNNIQ